MQRDMDLIREILFYVESEDGFDGVVLNRISGSPFDGRDWKEVCYHFILMLEFGLIRGQPRGSYNVEVLGLTWAGHEFLDNVRDEDVWEKTKTGVTKIGSFSFETVKEVAKATLKKRIEALSDMAFEE